MACRFCTVLPLHLWWSDPFGNVSQSYDQQHHLQCQKLEQIGRQASSFLYFYLYHIHFPTSLHQNDNNTSCLSLSAAFHQNKFHITSLYRERVVQTSIPNGSVTCDIATRPISLAKAQEMPTPLLATSLSHLLVLVAWNAVIYAFQPRSWTPLAKVQPDLQADLGWAQDVVEVAGDSNQKAAMPKHVPMAAPMKICKQLCLQSSVHRHWFKHL